jgi:glycine/D-amino acid oxidase-like deaminating enzyme
LEYDVIIVGAGVIGLSIAHKILSETSLSVALVDAARPCSGATGAG